MIGVLLITHDNLGESLIQCVHHVFGQRLPQLAQLGIYEQDHPAERESVAHYTLKTLDTGRGVIILTDLYGATPSNIASRLLRPGYVEVVAGVNLPMLVRVLTYRREEMALLVQRAVSGGCEGVLRIEHTLEEVNKDA